MDKPGSGFFDTIAERYIRKDITPYCRIARKLRLERSLKKIPKPIPALLEVGCGPGFSSVHLKGRCRRYVGLDSSVKFIEYACRHHASDQSVFIRGDIGDFETEERFDVILMIGVLHHLAEAEKVLLRIKSFLKPGGSVVACEPLKGNPLVGCLRRIRKKMDPDYSSDQREYSESQIRQVFARSGYRVVTFPQGVFSTPFAEVSSIPASIGLPLSYFFSVLDPGLEELIASSFLKNLAWNIVIQAVPNP